MFNTIVLKSGEARLTNLEYKQFSPGDTIMGNDSVPVEIKRWEIDQKAEAKAELSKLRCSYERYNEYLYSIQEYALEYCKCDEDGEFLEGSDYDFAREVISILKNSFDDELEFDDLEKAKSYFMPDLSEFPEESELAEGIEAALTLAELSDVLNAYSDNFGNGSRYFVKTV